MIRQFWNIRTLLAVIAIGIVMGTVFYSQYLAGKIADEEKRKVEGWIEALKSYLNPDNTDIKLPTKIMSLNTDMPIIEVDEKGVVSNYINLDTSKVKADSQYVYTQLQRFKDINPPIIYPDPLDSAKFNAYYYGHTMLLNEVKFYPIVQLLIVALFIIITILALRSNYKSAENQLWTSMAKETAHQLGTPVSSLEGWVEILKDKKTDNKVVNELSKDIDRLRLVSDRFGKIGSAPKLESRDLISQVGSMVDYIRIRASGGVSIQLHHPGITRLLKPISAPLFDWVIENLLKNALDAMDGKGRIDVTIQEDEKNGAIIDVKDTGKGIASKNISKVFQAGFTTKRRGWGLGLSLTKRIIEQYHQGQVFVKSSELGKGTTFRIILK